MRARYIRSAANVWADKLSRDREGFEDWMLNPGTLAELHAEIGPFTVDRFATANNTQLARFNALLRGPGVESVDALAQTDAVWRAERNWCHPPWGVLPRLAAKLRQSGASAAVVAPCWRSAPWFQELLEMCDTVRFEPARTDLFRPSAGGRRAEANQPGWNVALFDIPLRPRA